MGKKVTKIQQGDVILRRIAALPDGVTERKGLRHVLALGEATGHEHCVRSVDVCTYTKEVNGEEVLFLKVDKSAKLEHLKGTSQADHDAITIPPGVWERDIVREFDAFTEETKRVTD